MKASGNVLRAFNTLRKKYGTVEFIDHNKCHVEAKGEKKPVVIYEAGSPRNDGSYWFGLRENNMPFLGNKGLVGLFRVPDGVLDLFPVENLLFLIENDLLSRTSSGSHYHITLVPDEKRPHIKAKNLLSLQVPLYNSLTVA